ncbi:MAG: thioredoxin family protein [Candidatus Syntrophosphaera sp.]
MKMIIMLIMISAISMLGCVAKEPAQENIPAEETQTAETTPVETEEEPEMEEEFGTWITDYSRALELAERHGRPILVNFTGSDWCVWCFRLRDEVFTQKAFLDYAKSDLILLKLDFPQKTQLPPEQQMANQNLANRYGIRGFPTILLLDGEGNEISRTGYQPGGAENYVHHLKGLLGEG